MNNLPVLNYSINGIEDITAIFNQLAERHVVRITRNMNYQIAKHAQKEVQRSILDKLWRRTGTLKNSVRFKAVEKGSTNFVVYFSPRAFYWRFVEHGTPAAFPKPFLGGAVIKVREQLPLLVRVHFKQQLEKQLADELRYQARQAQRGR